MADCDSIARLVDLLGTNELLASAASQNDDNVEITHHHTTSAVKASKIEGLHFSGAHWYSRKDNVTTDSYTLKYQMAGTAHFCQTFAVMIHLGNDVLPIELRLKAFDYAKNIEKAMEFWLAFLKANPRHAAWLAPQRDFTVASLINELTDVKGSAENLTHCMQGL